jgi:tetratricopeptide (TPR) repeat protein
LADIPAIIGVIGGAVGILGGGGGLVGLWRTLHQEEREEHQAFFTSYEKSIATLERQVQRETDATKKEQKRQRLETVEDEYLEQQEAYRQDRALRQSAPRGALTADRPRPSEAVASELTELWQKARHLSPALLSADDRFLRGNALYDAGDFEAALVEYTAALELEPDDPDTLNNRGITFRRLERYDEALADYNRALELTPNAPDTLNNRGAALAYLARYEEALADFNRSLDLRPDDPTTLSNRGAALDDLGRYDEALADYNRSLEVRSDDPQTLNNRGIALSHLGHHEEALADYNRALEVRPDDPQTLTNRGLALAHLERYEEALADYNRSLELRPDHPNTLYNRACLFSLTERWTESLADLQAAAASDAGNRRLARKDEDFEGLRNDPEWGPKFWEIVGREDQP